MVWSQDLLKKKSSDCFSVASKDLVVVRTLPLFHCSTLKLYCSQDSGRGLSTLAQENHSRGRSLSPFPSLLQPRKASATCSSATAAASSGLEEWTSRSPRQRSSASSPEHPELHAELGIKPPSPGTVLALAKPPSPCAPGQ